MNLQQVKKDLDNGVLISPCTWLRVLETALELKSKNDQLAVLLETAVSQDRTFSWQKNDREFLTHPVAATES